MRFGSAQDDAPSAEHPRAHNFMDDSLFDAFDDGEEAPSSYSASAKRPPPAPTEPPPAKKPATAAAQPPPPPPENKAADDAAEQQLESTGKTCKHEVAMPPGQEVEPSMIDPDVPEGTVPTHLQV